MLARPSGSGAAAAAAQSGGLDGHAPAGLLKAAEDLHTLVWSLQARDVNRDVCERIGRQAAAIFALSARQAQESDRAVLFAETIDAVARRIMAALETIELELADRGEAPDFGSYAIPDPAPLDVLLARPMMMR